MNEPAAAAFDPECGRVDEGRPLRGTGDESWNLCSKGDAPVPAAIDVNRSRNCTREANIIACSP
jgi:hypothetical protein